MGYSTALIDLLLVALIVGAIVAFIAISRSVTASGKGERRYRTARVHRVLDGDSVAVAVGRRRKVVRLSAIDCPENGQHWGDTAKYGLIKLIGGRTVYLEEHTIDGHGRTVATIYVRSGETSEWVNVNARMVTLGHAWVYRQFYMHLPEEERQELDRREEWARRKRVGLWRAADPVPPWKWRRGPFQG